MRRISLALFLSPSLMSMIIGGLGTTFFLSSSFLLLIFYFKTKLSTILLHLALSELFLSFFVLAFMMSSFLLDDNAAIDLVMFIYALGNVSTILALLLAVVAFFLISPSQRMATKIILFGTMIMIGGFSSGFNIATVTFFWNGAQWQRQYLPLGLMLITLTLFLLFIAQFSIFYLGIMKTQGTDRESVQNKHERRLRKKHLIAGYLLSTLLVMGTFFLISLSTTFTQTIIYPIIQIFFLGINQLILAASITLYPKDVLFSNVTIQELGVYSMRDGLTIFHLTTFREDSNGNNIDRDLLTVALKGMEGVISRIIGAQQPMTTIGFGDRSIIFVKVDAHYFYAIVSDANYTARDVTTRLAHQWRKFYQRFKNEPLLTLTEKPEVRRFISQLQAFVLKYLTT